jgi:hypothetical protein
MNNKKLSKLIKILKKHIEEDVGEEEVDIGQDGIYPILIDDVTGNYYIVIETSSIDYVAKKNGFTIVHLTNNGN